MDTKYSCAHCGQHVIIQDAPAGASVNCPACHRNFNLPDGRGLKHSLASPAVWAVALLIAVGAVAVFYFLSRPKAIKSVPVQAQTAAKTEEGPISSTIIEGRPLTAWVEDVDPRGPAVARDRAIAVLKNTGRDHVEELIALATKPPLQRRHRGNATLALGYVGKNDGPEVQAVMTALNDANNYVIFCAIYSLRRLNVNSPTLVPLFIEKLDYSEKTVRRSAADNLGQLGTAAEAAIPGLEKMAKEDEEPNNRAMAAYALKRITKTSNPVPTRVNRDQ